MFLVQAIEYIFYLVIVWAGSMPLTLLHKAQTRNQPYYRESINNRII